jgi:NADH dehydrogenase/NADH:ubiquinone oxidoreductase subunit G
LIKYIWLLLPTITYTEDHFSYLNLEGRYRATQVAIKSPITYNDSKIFQCLTLLKNKLINNNFSIINDFYIYLDKFKYIINFSNFFHIDDYYIQNLYIYLGIIIKKLYH